MTRTTTTCIHRWRIESPNGPTSTGVCQRCGATREFVNYIETPVQEGRVKPDLYIRWTEPVLIPRGFSI